VSERVELRVNASDLRRWRVTASIEGVQLSEWIRRCCNAVAVTQSAVDAVGSKGAP
jgi:predicted DNA binding CopG/RHH family protein